MWTKFYEKCLAGTKNCQRIGVPRDLRMEAGQGKIQRNPLRKNQNSHFLKYLRSRTLGCKDKGIRKPEFVAKTQFL